MTDAAPLEVLTFTAPGFGENAYLVHRVGAASAVAVDPGGEAGAMARTLDARGLRLEAVVLTHAHIDHIEGVADLVRQKVAPIYLHPDDREWYDRAKDQAVYFGLPFQAPPPPDHALADDETLELAGIRIEVRHVPGHSPGHVILYIEEAGIAFVGDVVFQGSIGRSDLPGGDFGRLMRSIREQVLTLPDETVLYPGHGPATTVQRERVSNPFLVPDIRGGFA